MNKKILKIIFIALLFNGVMPPIKQGNFKLELAGCFLTKSDHKIALASCS